jgi:hypothetical protein
MLSLITVLTWPAWHSAALAIGFSILVNALDPLLDLDAEPPVGSPLCRARGRQLFYDENHPDIPRVRVVYSVLGDELTIILMSYG